MKQQTYEMIEVAAHEDAHDLAAYMFDELPMGETEAQAIKAGGDLTTIQPAKPCLGCGWGGPLTNHNETLAEDDAHNLVAYLFDELPLGEAEAREIKAGGDLTTVQPPKPCIGCDWGPPMTNHNETLAEDENACISYSFADLAVAEAEQITGGVTPPGTGKTLSAALLGQ